MKYCGDCGCGVKENSSYCPSCGKYIKKAEPFSISEEEMKFCLYCGAKVEKTYCGQCGAYVKSIHIQEQSNGWKPMDMKIPRKSWKKNGEENKTKRNWEEKFKSFKKPKFLIPLLCLIVLFTIGGSYLVNTQILEPQREKNSTKWERYTENGKIGYKDSNGKIMLAAKYSGAGTFSSNGLTKVVGEDYLWGYMNYKGKMVIEPKYEGAGDFSSNGLARVCVGGKYGYIDKTGNYVIKPKYEDAGDFAENGLAFVKDVEERKYGYIDNTGNYVIKPKFDQAFHFSKNGLARVSIDEGYGYIDENGKYVINAIYEEAGDFAENGLAWVKNEEGYYNFINENGKTVIKTEYEYATDFTENGLAMVAVEHERTGEMVRPDDYDDYYDDYLDYYYDDYDSYEDYYEDYYGDSYEYDTYDEDGNYDDYAYDCGFIDKSGKYVIEPKYAEALPFQENGLAWVYIYKGDDGYIGLIDENGDYVMKTVRCHSLGFPAKNGLTTIKMDADKEWGYIDEEGKYKIKEQYTNAEDFSENGLAVVGIYDEEDGGWRYGYINAEGKTVIDFKYSEAESFGENGLAYVVDEVSYYINAKGKKVKEAE